jgi:hypothetical protein
MICGSGILHKPHVLRSIAGSAMETFQNNSRNQGRCSARLNQAVHYLSIARQAPQPGICIRGIPNCGVGYDPKIFFTTQVIDPWQGGVRSSIDSYTALHRSNETASNPQQNH